MSGPRLNIGVVGRNSLGSKLEAVGHTVITGIGPADVGIYDLVILDVGAGLPEAVEQIAPYARRGQMYVHTSLEYGVQALDGIEITGAVVLAAYDIGDNNWVTAANDELGEGIIELLVGEFGGTSIPVTDAQRLRIRAALEYRDLAVRIKNDARAMLVDTLGNPELAEDMIPTDLIFRDSGATIDDYDRMHRTIDDSGRAHMFASLVRRCAELRHNQDLELWAISKLDYKE